MELGDAVVDELQHLLCGHCGCDQRMRLWVVVEPSKRSAIQPGMRAPQRAAKPEICLKLWIGWMPGTMGAVPRPAPASSTTK